MVREWAGKRRGIHTARCVCRGDSASSTECLAFPSISRIVPPAKEAGTVMKFDSAGFFYCSQSRVQGQISCRQDRAKHMSVSDLCQTMVFSRAERTSPRDVRRTRQRDWRCARPIACCGTAPVVTRALSPHRRASSDSPSRRQTACWSSHRRTARSRCPQSRPTCRAS